MRSSPFFSLLLALAFSTVIAGPSTASAQSSRDITAPITGSGSQLRRIIQQDRQEQRTREARKAAERSTAEGGVQVNIQRAGTVRGNLEVRTEVEEEIFDAKDAVRLGRIKAVFMQGHLNSPQLPNWWAFVHLAQEWLFTDGLEGTRQERSNVIVEVNPRYQKQFGSGIYGLELGFSTEGRWEISRLRLRPFVEYWVSRECRIVGSVSGGYTFLELNGNEPDFAFAAAEPGMSCFVGDQTIIGFYSKVQFGWNLNDDNGARNTDGTAFPSYGITKSAVEWRVSPFVHHRLRNQLGLTLWAEFARVEDDARNDSFFYDDFWQKVVLFLEYPIQPDFIINGEVSFKRGDRRLADARYNANAFSFADDFSYISLSGQLGINYFF